MPGDPCWLTGSVVLAWLWSRATGFGLGWAGLGLKKFQARPKAKSLAWPKPWPASVTVCLLANDIFLFSLHHWTHLLFSMFSYKWVHCLLLFNSLNTSLIELWPHAILLSYHWKGNSLSLILAYYYVLICRQLSLYYPILSYQLRVPVYSLYSCLFHNLLRLCVLWYK